MPGDGLRWANGDSLWGSQLTKAALNSSLPMLRLNDMVTRIVASWYKLGQDNTSKWPAPPPKGDGGPSFSSWTNDRIGLLHPGSDDKAEGVVNQFIDVQGTGNASHGALVRRIAAEGTVLVKNDGGVLPLSKTGWSNNTAHFTGSKMRVAVFGEDATSGKGKNACADRGCNQGT